MRNVSTYHVAFAQDGTVLPALKGGVASMVSLMEALARTRTVTPYLLWCYRGWGNLNAYRHQAFGSILLRPDVYYRDSVAVGVVARRFRLHAAHLYSAEEVLSLGRNLQRAGTRLVYEVLDVEHELARQLGKSRRAQAARACCQRRALRQADWVLCRSSQDRRSLIALGSNPRRTTAYRSGISVSGPIPDPNRRPGKNIVFLGHLFYPPNCEALGAIRDVIVPQLRRLDPSYVVHPRPVIA